MEKIIEGLQGFHGKWWLQDSEGYKEVIAGLGSSNRVLASRSPYLVAQPVCTEDVCLAVRAASLGFRYGVSGNVPLCVRGGGHSELAVMDGALALDMRQMAEIQWDPELEAITLEAGATLGRVQAVAGSRGYSVPTGLHESVGIGSLLQGGVGHLTRRHGLSIDNVLSIEMVLATGEVTKLDASAKTSDSRELFWGMCGAGPNFAIVTRLTIRAFKTGPVLHGRIQNAIENIEESARDLAKRELAIRGLERDQYVDLVMGYAPVADGTRPMVALFPGSLDGRNFSSAEAQMLGFSNADLISSAFQELPYPGLESQDARADTTEQGSPEVLSYVRQCFVDELGYEGFLVLLKAVQTMPSSISQIMLQHGGGVIRETPADSRPFAPRSWEYSVVIVALWVEESSEARGANEKWADSVFDALQTFTTGLYSVDIAPDRRPNEVQQEVLAAFKGNLQRLQFLKKKFDPENLFRGTYCFFDENNLVEARKRKEPSILRKCALICSICN